MDLIIKLKELFFDLLLMEKINNYAIIFSFYNLLIVSKYWVCVWVIMSILISTQY